MGTPKISRFPEVYATLFDLWQAELGIGAGSQRLIKGGASTNDYGEWVAFFGYRPSSEDWVTINRAAPEGMAANDIETITIGVLVAATKSDHDMQAALELVAAKFAALETVVTRDPRLGLRGVEATISARTAMPLHTTKGAEWNETADVEIKVFL